MTTIRPEPLLLRGIMILAIVAISSTAAQINAQVIEPVLPGTENSVSNQGLQPVPDNQLRNSGLVPKEQEKPLEPDEVRFVFGVEHGELNHNYRLCAGITGEFIQNFGCDSYTWDIETDTSGSIGHYWLFSIENAKNSMLYGCVIGDTEKKVSCQVTALPQPPTEQRVTIDWSKPSPMDMPPTFRPYISDAGDLRAEMQGMAQSQRQNDDKGNNNDDEDEDEDEDN